MSHELPKAYDPSAIEARWAQYWAAEKLFALSAPDSGENVFDLLLPPPNVTGRLHMGHMLNQTEMDIIIRWRRMSGFQTLWLPGTDHAGIATQMMVERQLASEGAKRQELGREKFIERVWEWKRHYGGAILDQMKRLGVSVDWEREYFTMDDRLSRAVREAFVRLHEKGLIYRGKYIVNWCPRCVTAISDLEVAHEDVAGKLYEIRYPLLGEAAGFITVATTRPETMLGDTAVAVNPNDERYKHLIGRSVMLPLIHREIPIIADDWANPEFGTGAVKVTPAHDPNDFAIGQRHHLPQINVMDEYGYMNENAGPYAGLDRSEARARVIADLEALGLLAAVKDHTLAMGKCDRCKAVVEPRLSTQWFVKVEGAIAQRAIEAVKRGHIQITPENYRAIYLNWMENIHDWCISRQLWWGHRIPAWHCADCKQDTVARATPERCVHCHSVNIEQDSDVLDTWFSSGLLPFTVFGWPEAAKDLKVFYPTSLLITGFDILFFWVARMIMMGCWFMGGEDALDLSSPGGDDLLKNCVPFRNVYIHALVRDADRQKMSKTKGNVVDPIEIIERFGTDAVRFTLASMAAPGTDIAFNEERTQGYRAFANKIWNAARFIFMNVDRAKESGAWSLSEFDPALATDAATLEDRWISSRLNDVTLQVNRALGDYRFDDAANAIYRFFWGEFCDWYIEIVKLRLNAGDSESDRATTRIALNFLMHIFERSLLLLSPFMPFITEEIWHAIYDGKPPLRSIALAAFPKAETKARDMEAEEQMEVVQNFIVTVRELRADAGVPPREAVPVLCQPASGEVGRIIAANEQLIRKLANAASVNGAGTRGAWTRHTALGDIAIVYEKQIDVAAERERLTKELRKLETELTNARRNLANEQFLAKAPAQVVEGIRRREGELTVLIEKSRSAIAFLD